MNSKTIVIGNRIPNRYFVTKGKGESDITIHAGSYHLALKDAGVECYNIMTYSSIMPGSAKEVEQPKQYVHGAVLESIMAVAHAKKGERATAGIIYSWLYDKETGKKYGGLVCEHNGNYSVDGIEAKLKDSLNELYENGFSGKYELRDERIMIETLIAQKEHGTALVAIGFVDYIVPIIE